MKTTITKIYGLTALLLLLSGTGSANEIESLRHKVVPDNVIKRGSIVIQSNRLENGTFTVVANYKVKLRFPYLMKFEGKEDMNVPSRFLTEEGVLELENMKAFSDDQVLIEHQGRVDFREFYDCHILKLTPRKKRDWEATILYHPDVPSIGWAKVDITFTDIPIIKRHTLHSYYTGN